jgi:hypothetical protein
MRRATAWMVGTMLWVREAEASYTEHFLVEPSIRSALHWRVTALDLVKSLYGR